MSIAALMGVAVLLLLPAASAAQEEIPDDNITMGIEGELVIAPAVEAQAIDVTTRKGVVTLSGRVSTLLARRAAVKIARSIKGVRSVIDRIEVNTPERDDDALRRDVKKSLLYDPVTESFELDVEVEDGVVTLAGEVDSWQERNQAEDVAASVRGVRDLENEIQVQFVTTRPDYEIKKDVQDRLASIVCIDEGLIDVTVEDGEVSLSGAVGSAAERRRAEDAAWVRGALAVDGSGLAIKWWARDAMCRTDRYADLSDTAVRNAVKDAFLYDPRLLSFRPNVKVEEGVVTLTGEVGSLAAKRAAAEDARNTRGVWRVKNHLRVRGEEAVQDVLVEADVESALERDAGLSRFDLEATVVNGHVHLYGQVDTRHQEERALDLAAAAAGALAVTEHLTVDEKETDLTDWEMEENIRDQFFWSPYVDLPDVAVEVENGVATLTGKADTWYEWHRAEKNAYEGGALDVVNLLTVEYGPDYYREKTGEEE